MRFELIGINHETSSLEVRDRAAMGPEEISIQLKNLLKMANIDGAVILSTCNRTELYVSALHHQKDREFRDLFLRLTRLTAADISAAYIYRDSEAVSHLLKVASGLNSQLIGEKQILKQVKDAYYQALELHATNSILNRVFYKGIECGKSVRHRTGISKGSVSVASAAVELSGRIFGSFTDTNVLLVGAGDTIILAVKFFENHNVKSWRISNRTRSNALKVAENIGAEVVQFPPADEDIAWADIILSATSCPNQVITIKQIADSASRKREMKLFLDLAVPRDIDPRIQDMTNSYLYTVDDFQELVAANLQTRKHEAARALKIVEKLVNEFSEWYQENRIAPTIRQLKEVLESIRVEEVKRNVNRFKPADHDQVDKFSRSLMRKVTSLIISNLKRASHEKDDVRLAKAITIALSSDDKSSVNEVLEKLENEFSH